MHNHGTPCPSPPPSALLLAPQGPLIRPSLLPFPPGICHPPLGSAAVEALHTFSFAPYCCMQSLPSSLLMVRVLTAPLLDCTRTAQWWSSATSSPGICVASSPLGCCSAPLTRLMRTWSRSCLLRSPFPLPSPSPPPLSTRLPLLGPTKPEGSLRWMQGAAIGERIFFGEGGESQPEPETANKVPFALVGCDRIAC